LRPAVEVVVAQGNSSIVGRDTGRSRPTARTYESHFIHLFTCHDGKVLEFRESFDSASLLGVPSSRGTRRTERNCSP
jgi:ketosteroid isomerase-like protein